MKEAKYAGGYVSNIEQKSLENNFTSYVVAAILFLCVSIPLTRLTDHLLQRERIRTTGTNIA